MRATKSIQNIAFRKVENWTYLCFIKFGQFLEFLVCDIEPKTCFSGFFHILMSPYKINEVKDFIVNDCRANDVMHETRNLFGLDNFIVLNMYNRVFLGLSIR